MCVCMLSHVQLFVTLWTVACQAPVSMGFFRREYWSGSSGPRGWTPVPCVSCLTGGFFTTEPPGKFYHFSFPGGLDGNESAFNAGDLGLILGLGRSTWVGNDCALRFSSVLAWRIPWTQEPGRLQSMGSQRVRHNWATNTFTLLSTWHEA